MEDYIENTPASAEPSQSDVTENAPVSPGPAEEAATDAVENEPQSAGRETSAESEKERNNLNAQRRIRNREGTKARIRELEARLARYEGRDDDYSKFRREQLEDRIGDMRAMASDDDANDFEDHASRFFGRGTPQFMRDTYRYAGYVNAHEPDLLNYAQREYGPLLLAQWYSRMDVPELRRQWLGMTQFEKGRVLDRFYSQIAEAATGSGNARRDVPVPSGGRQSSGSAPSNDFGVELGRAFNRHRG